jgi:hypothetical protein
MLPALPARMKDVHSDAAFVFQTPLPVAFLILPQKPTIVSNVMEPLRGHRIFKRTAMLPHTHKHLRFAVVLIN